jgi:hypothetical protein
LKSSLGDGSGNAPIVPPRGVKAHSDEWTNYYLDRYAVTELKLHVPQEDRGLARGGMAEAYSARTIPIAPRRGVKPHSDEWNAVQFDRYGNLNIVSPVIDHQERGQWRGGLARDVQPFNSITGIGYYDLTPLTYKYYRV